MLPFQRVSWIRFTLPSSIVWRCALAVLPVVALAQERGRLLGVRAGGDAAAASIELLGDRPLSFTTLKLSAPPRVVVDFADTEVMPEARELAVEDGTVRRVAAAAAGQRTARVVIELAAEAEFDVRAHGSRVEVRVPRIAPLLAQTESSAPAGTAPPAEAAPGSAPSPAGSEPRAGAAETGPTPSGGEQESEKRASPPAVSLLESHASRPESAPESAGAGSPSLAAPKTAAAPSKMTPPARLDPAAEKRRAREERIAAYAASQREAAEKVAAVQKAVRARRLAAEQKAAADKKARAVAAAEKAARSKQLAAEKAVAARRLAAEKAEQKKRAGAAAQKTDADRRAARSAVRPQRKVAMAQRHAITGIGFRPINGGEVIGRSDQPLEYGVSDDDNALLLHLPSAGIPLPNNRRPLDTRFFGGPVQRVVPVARENGTDLRIELRGHADYQLAQSGTVLTVTFSAPR